MRRLIPEKMLEAAIKDGVFLGPIQKGVEMTKWYVEGAGKCRNGCIVTKCHALTVERNKLIDPLGCPDDYTPKQQNEVNAIIIKYSGLIDHVIAMGLRGLG